MIDFKIIAYGSAEYKEMVALRNKILREPLGLVFTGEEKKKDESDFLLAAVRDDNKVVACCILTPLNQDTVQLRQMAVDEYYQGKGIGREMVVFAEKTALGKGFKYLCLHARESATGFYEKQSYKIEGESFIEVGISHVEMMKILEIEK